MKRALLSSMNEFSVSSAVSRSFVRDYDFLNPHSKLNYLQSIGSIRMIRYAKYQNINNVSTARDPRGAPPLIWSDSRNNWDRWDSKIKLKISYRTGRMDLVQKEQKDEIQVALIIYESMEKLTRRNLLNEFQKVAEECEEQ